MQVKLSILIVITIAVYANSLSGPLVLDDLVTIADNASIRDLGSIAATLQPEREQPTAGRPLANLSFAINYALGGLSVQGYHVVNLLLHVLCVVMLWLLLEQVRLRQVFRETGEGLPFAIALIWAVHPLNSEVVNYLTQRTESLMALCYLATLYASVRALDGDRTRWMAAAVAACALGVGMKESIVTAPVMVVLLDRLVVFDSWQAAWRERRGLYAGLFASWMLVAATVATGPRIRSAGFSAGVDLWTWLLNQAQMITQYLWLTLWPRPLVVYYGWPQPLTLGDVLPHALLVVAIIAATVAALRYDRRLGFLGAWFFATLAPTSSFVPIATEVGAERRMYLPLIALLVLFVGVIWRAVPRAAARQGLLAGLVILLGVTTFARNGEYADTLTLARVTNERWPSPQSHHMLGEQLIKAGRREEGIAELQEATRTGAPRAHFSLGEQFFAEGRLDAAIAEFRGFIDKQPLLLEVPQAHLLLARSYARQQRWEEAAVEARLAIDKAQNNPEARLVYAEILFNQEKVAEATQAYASYLQLRPADADAYTKLGVLLMTAGRTQEGVAAFRRALDLDPGNADRRRNLETALADAR